MVRHAYRAWHRQAGGEKGRQAGNSPRQCVQVCKSRWQAVGRKGKAEETEVQAEGVRMHAWHTAAHAGQRHAKECQEAGQLLSPGPKLPVSCLLSHTELPTTTMFKILYICIFIYSYMLWMREAAKG